jgi:hypothetical protein
MRKAISATLWVVIIILTYFVIDSPLEQVRFDNDKHTREEAIIQNLMDIRTAQVKYKEKYGNYTSGLDTLINFAKNDSLPNVLKEGFLTDSMVEAGMTEEKAVRLGIIIRDTTFVSALSVMFGEDYPIDELANVPFTESSQFEMGAGIYRTGSGVPIQVFEARVPYEIYMQGLGEQEIKNMIAKAFKYEKYPGLKVGSLAEANNNAGNWE